LAALLLPPLAASAGAQTATEIGHPHVNYVMPTAGKIDPSVNLSTALGLPDRCDAGYALSYDPSRFGENRGWGCINTVAKADDASTLTGYSQSWIRANATGGSVGYASQAGSAGSATTASLANYANSAGSASTASSATYATSAGSANYANSAGSATTASSANYANSAGSANYANSAGSAGYASNAGYANSAGSAANANVAGNLKMVAGNVSANPCGSWSLIYNNYSSDDGYTGRVNYLCAR
jgi:hypothetical protein